MFERFTDRARRVPTLAREEAGEFKHNYIGTEHLLLGIIRKGDGVAVKALINLGADLNVLRTKTLELLGMHGTEAPGQPPTDSGTVCPFDIVLPGGVYVGLHDVPADNLKEVLLEAADRLGELAARL